MEKNILGLIKNDNLCFIIRTRRIRNSCNKSFRKKYSRSNKKINWIKITCRPRVATLKKFNKNGGKELIDEGVIIWFPGPNSYTGEDLAEFHVHGSRAVIKAMHLAISKVKNCRLAEPRGVYKKSISKWKNKFTKSRKHF